MLDGAQVFRDAFREGLMPDPELTVSQWAQQYRRLGASNAAEGPWDNARTPYSVEIMNELSPSSSAEVVVFMKASQIGGTEVLLNFYGYCIDQAPGPILVVMPRKEDAREYAKTKIDPMIEACPRLRAKVREARSRDSGNTTFSKSFPGGPMRLAGANAAAGLRFMAVRYAGLDEIDAYPLDVQGEGDPVELVRARQRTFMRRKLALVSSPTVTGRSRIEKAFLATDQRFYHVPCPFCGFYQRLQFDHLRYVNDDPSTVLYGCDSCGAGIEEHYKTEMLAAGRWVASSTEGQAGWVGFHLSSLYSPLGWHSWREVVAQWLDARKTKDQAKLKTFLNTVLGETWEERGEAPPWQPLYARREPYPIGVVPDRGLVLTAGIDVQGDRIELEVVAWARGLESWSVEYIVLPGKTTEPEVWLDLDRVLAREWKHAAGGRMPLLMAGIDSSFATSTVYAWAVHHSVRQVMVCRGQTNLQVPVGQPLRADVTLAGRMRARGLRVWPVGVGMLKSQLYGWLRHELPLERPAPPGYIHFPEYGQEWFEQLTAEALVPRVRRGHRFTTTTEWVKTRERNEALDARVYARAAAHLAGVDRYEEAHWTELERRLGLASPPPRPEDAPRPPAPEATGVPPETNPGPRREGRFDRWRKPRTR